MKVSLQQIISLVFALLIGACGEATPDSNGPNTETQRDAALMHAFVEHASPLAVAKDPDAVLWVIRGERILPNGTVDLNAGGAWQIDFQSIDAMVTVTYRSPQPTDSSASIHFEPCDCNPPDRIEPEIVPTSHEIVDEFLQDQTCPSLENLGATLRVRPSGWNTLGVYVETQDMMWARHIKKSDGSLDVATGCRQR